MYFLPASGQSSLGGMVPVSTAVAAPSDSISPPSYDAIVLDPNGPRSQTNLFVRKLASAVTEEDMMKLFAPYGTVVSFVLMRNIHSGESLGTSFVRFETHDQARDAMASLDGKELYGRVISIQWAKKQHDGTLVGDARKRIHKLFVRNVPLDVTGRQLRTLFSKYGTINNVTLLSDTAADITSEQPERNIAFILFQEDGAAEVAVRAQHNTCPFPSCEGIPLMVKLAEDNRQRLERRQRFGEAIPPSSFFDSQIVPDAVSNTADISAVTGAAGSFMTVSGAPMIHSGNFVLDNPATAGMVTSNAVSPYMDNLSHNSSLMSPAQQTQTLAQPLRTPLQSTQPAILGDAGSFAYVTSPPDSSGTLTTSSSMQNARFYGTLLQQQQQTAQQHQHEQRLSSADLMATQSPFFQNISQVPNMTSMPAAFQTQLPSFAMSQQTTQQSAAVLGSNNTACFSQPTTTSSPMCFSLSQDGQSVLCSPGGAPLPAQPMTSFIPVFFSHMPGAAAPVQMATTTSAASAPTMYNATSPAAGQTVSAPQHFVQAPAPTAASNNATQLQGPYFGPPTSLQMVVPQQVMGAGLPAPNTETRHIPQLGSDTRQLSQTMLNSFSLPSNEVNTPPLLAPQSAIPIPRNESTSSVVLNMSQRTTVTPALGAMPAANLVDADAAVVNATTRPAAHDHPSQSSSLSSGSLSEMSKTTSLPENLSAIVHALKKEKKDAQRGIFPYGGLNLDDSDKMPISNEFIKELKGAGRISALHKIQSPTF